MMGCNGEKEKGEGRREGRGWGGDTMHVFAMWVHVRFNSRMNMLVHCQTGE